MNTLNFPDANVWLALLWTGHLHSDRATQWFAESGEQEFFFCRFTQLAVLRLLTTESILGTDAKTMAEAWRLWDRIWADTRIAFVPEPEGLDAEFRIRSRLSSKSPKVWADAYLLSFAAATGLKFVTFDRALKSPGVDILTL
jgi:toxin-antitoxin system PIN domain toxin